MLTGIEAQWRRRLWALAVMARSPLSPAPRARCSALRRGSRWLTLPSDTAAAAAATPPKTPTGPAVTAQKKARIFERTPNKLHPAKNKEFVRPQMPYPYPRANNRSAGAVYQSLTAQNLFEDSLGSQNKDMPSWADTIRELESRTPRRATAWKRHALKIVIPAEAVKSLTTNLDDNIWDINERTMCEIELYEGVEQRGRSALLLSGDDIVVHEAANLIMSTCEGARISHPNPSNRAAPLLQGNPNIAEELCISSKISHRPSFLSPAMKKGAYIWNNRFEDIPKPPVWDQYSFMTYICTLALAEMRPHQAAELYGSADEADNVRMDLIHEAFEDRTAADAITASAFRIALGRIAERGTSFRHRAYNLFTVAQARRLHIDTSTFNKLLLGPTRDHNLAYFNHILGLMASSGCTPNYLTWRLFLLMVYDEKAKRGILLTMDKIGLLHNPHATSDMVREMAGFDMHRAIRSGKDVGTLCREMDETYGPSWPSMTTMNRMIDVCCRFHRFEMCHELVDRFERVYQRSPDAGTFQRLFTGAELTRSFPAMLKVLRRQENQPWLKKTPDSYNKIFTLAWRWRLANVMAVVWTYACLEDVASFAVRFRVSRHLARPGYKMHTSFRILRPSELHRFFAMPGYVADELRGDLDRELQADPSQARSQGAVIARLFRERLRSYVPSAPLSEMIEKAWEVDKRLLQQRKTVLKKPGSHIVSIQEPDREEYHEVPVRHIMESKVKVVKVPATTALMVHNFEKSWYGDIESHPLTGYSPWECRLNDERDRPKPVEFTEGSESAEGEEFAEVEGFAEEKETEVEVARDRPHG